jgi:hypothetical protein
VLAYFPCGTPLAAHINTLNEELQDPHVCGSMFWYGHTLLASRRRKETLISGVLLWLTCSDARDLL